MDSSEVFCHNPDCPARGKLGRVNMGIYSRKKRRCICHLCGKTYTESKGTVFYPRVREDGLLFCVDGFSAYVSSIQKVFRTPIFTGKQGRPHLRAWEHVCIAQVIKHVSRKRVVGFIKEGMVKIL